MPNKYGEAVRKYRVTVEQYVTWSESPTSEERKLPRVQGSSDLPESVDKAEWRELDCVTTANSATFSGALEAIANRYKPSETKTYR
jgi:hypothetical protein